MNNSAKNIKSVKDIKNIFINIFPIFLKTKNKIGIFSMCAYRIPKKNKVNIFSKYLQIHEEKFEVKTLLKRGIGVTFGKYTYYFNIYKVMGDVQKLIYNPPQNLCSMIFESDNINLELPMVYNLIYYSKYLGKVGKLYKYKNHDLVCYFRQTKMNSIAVTVRKNNITDAFFEKIKIFFAKVLSVITLPKDIILLYEKEANKYEESASVVYEKLIDLGYKNCYFIIKKDSKHVPFIKEKYKKNIVWAYTFKHYYYFFKCHKFIGTESVPHSMELRAANQYITRKMIVKKYKQIFLQHGVMYMVALNPTSRSAFMKGGNEMPIDAKIVVSSELEREHFVELGGFEREDLYVTGLPFYDRTIKNENADKIVIMLTWRSWEYNILEADYKNSNYYKMIKNIIKNIPNEYMDKVVVLPHPLIFDKFKNTDLNNLIPDVISYDKILEDTALLITDYSSISYSAFYRGANVIFCWEELEECMKNYESHLMLNEKNAFGDVSINYEDISSLVRKNYLKPQNEEHKNRYKKIVQFDDNKNTDRLIECLKKDNII